MFGVSQENGATNLEQAIDCFRQAEAIFTLEAFPREYAQGQHFLATAYSQRISGEQRDNLEQAITYYQLGLAGLHAGCLAF